MNRAQQKARPALARRTGLDKSPLAAELYAADALEPLMELAAGGDV